MKPAPVSLCLIVIAGLLIGCSDSEPNYPIGDGGWQLVLDVGHIPNSVDDYPIHVTIEAQAIDLTSGARPADGTALLFSSSDGTFRNGLPNIELMMVDGETEASLQVNHAGHYEVSVEFPAESCTAVTVFSVGI